MQVATHFGAITTDGRVGVMGRLEGRMGSVWGRRGFSWNEQVAPAKELM